MWQPGERGSVADIRRNNSGRTRILIVEDDRGLAELMASILEEGRYESRCSFSGREALLWLGVNGAELVILDYSLPDMTGGAFLESMQRQGLSIPFIIVTGKDDASLAVEMMRNGACDYLLKDTSFLDRLPAVVTRALQEAETRERLERAKVSLRLSEARLARAQKIARMGSWEWDLGGGDIYWSDELYRIFGFNPGEPGRIDRKWIYNLIDNADLPSFKRDLLRSVRTLQPFNVIYRTVSRGGEELVVNVQGEVEAGEDGRARLLSGTVLDITARMKAENEIHQLINYDTLTGLPNRNLLHDRLRLAIAKAAQDKHAVWVLCLDLDHFKGINDTLGHRTGDRLLQDVAKRLTACVRESDTLARLGGDEFVVVLNGVVNEKGATIVAKKILGVISEPLFLDGHELYVTASIGIAAYPMDGEDGHALLKHADLAMYKAKEQDRNDFHFFSHDLNVKVMERMRLETSMRKALERNEFFLLYQPQVDARTGSVIGVEALLRWNHPDMGLLTPDRFIYLAEENGFIIPLGEWVLATACRQNREWQERGLPPLRVSVNLSGRQFGQQRLDEMISAILWETSLSPQWLELEITESAIMKNAEQNITILRKLKEMGIALAIDDFGTGYSSLSYLKHFPLTRLKIDRSFVRDITDNPDDAAIAKIIIAMAQTLKLSVIAEGVETRAQMELLSFHNCVEMQGYLFSRPVTAHEIADLLQNGISY